MLKVEFSGQIRGGRLIIADRKYFDEVIAASRDGQVSIKIESQKSKRTTKQNRAYWGVYIRTVCEAFRNLGNDASPNDVHEFLKERFLQDMVEAKTLIDAHGEVHEIREISSKTLSKARFIDYLVQIEVFASEFLGVQIPEIHRAEIENEDFVNIKI